jgi:hypothetical protein
MTRTYTKPPLDLMPLSSLAPDLLEEEDPCEEDFWVQMPPHSIREVVMNVTCMGRAKPLPFDWDEVLEEAETDSPDNDTEA